jgi:hypothetical protein
VLADDTVRSVENRRNGSLRKLAVSLGYDASFAATLSDILRRKDAKISRDRENDLRFRLGLPPLECGQAATGRAPRADVFCVDDALLARLDALSLPGETRTDALRRLLGGD